jgi:hypothetical protein
VTGRVILKNNPNAAMPPDITLQAVPVVGPAVGRADLAAQRNAPSATTTTLPVSRDGTFKADLYATDQSVSVVGLPNGYSVAALTYGGKDVLRDPLLFQSGAELVVSIKVGDARALYRVVASVREDSSDRPLAGERIELVNSAGSKVSLTTNVQGTATFPGLPDGTYTLRLVSTGFDAFEKKIVITDGSVEVELRANEKR